MVRLRTKIRGKVDFRIEPVLNQGNNNKTKYIALLNTLKCERISIFSRHVFEINISKNN
jgi:hypothetical protein